MYSSFERHRDLIAVGAYAEGSDPEVDEARRRFPALQNFLTQELSERASLRDSIAALAALLPAAAA
jgi:flagellum-specific ATP synthase